MNLPDPQVAQVAPNPPGSPDAPRQDGPAVGPAKAGRLWLWFVAAFVVQILVWTAWITIAHRNPVAEVPLAGAGAPTPDGRGQRSDDRSQTAEDRSPRTDLSQPPKPGT